MTRFFTTTSLLPLVVLALSLSAWQADAADSADPAKALEGLLKPDAAGPLGGTLTGLQYTGFGLSHIKRDDADAPQFDGELRVMTVRQTHTLTLCLHARTRTQPQHSRKEVKRWQRTP